MIWLRLYAFCSYFFVIAIAIAIDKIETTRKRSYYRSDKQREKSIIECQKKCDARVLNRLMRYEFNWLIVSKRNHLCMYKCGAAKKNAIAAFKMCFIQFQAMKFL